MQPSKSPDPTYDGPAHTVSRTFNTSPWRKRLLREWIGTTSWGRFWKVSHITPSHYPVDPIGNAGVIFQVAVISIEEEAVLGSSENLELWQDEVDTLGVPLFLRFLFLISRRSLWGRRLFTNVYFLLVTSNVSFHSVSSSQCIDVVTSVQGKSYYGRGIDLNDPTGICIIETPKVLFVTTFKKCHNNGVPALAIPYVITFAEKLSELWHVSLLRISYYSQTTVRFFFW